MEGYFFKVYKDLLFIEELSLVDLLILSTLINYQQQDRVCYLTTKDFMYDCNASRRTIERSFKRLKALKLVAIVKIDGKYAKMLRTNVLERKLGYNKGKQDKAVLDEINALREKLNIKDRIKL